MLSDVFPGRSFGIACWQGEAGPMTLAHRHDDLEFNVAGVDLEYLVDGRPWRIPAGRLAVFWAARPHQLVSASPSQVVTWLTVPLDRVLRWGLRTRFVERMLVGDVALLGAGSAGALERRVPGWREELAGDEDENVTAALEIEAFARRVARSALSDTATIEATSAVRSEPAIMAAWISEHAHEDVRVRDVAQEVHLHPHHAMAVFRAGLGITIGEYLTQCRIARAQQLLLTTTMPVPEVGFAAGFRSQSQFYARFRERCGEPPAAYRRRLAAAAQREPVRPSPAR